VLLVAGRVTQARDGADKIALAIGHLVALLSAEKRHGLPLGSRPNEHIMPA
jgi:hypothetical protein